MKAMQNKAKGNSEGVAVKRCKAAAVASAEAAAAAGTQHCNPPRGVASTTAALQGASVAEATAEFPLLHDINAAPQPSQPQHSAAAAAAAASFGAGAAAGVAQSSGSNSPPPTTHHNAATSATSHHAPGMPVQENVMGDELCASQQVGDEVEGVDVHEEKVPVTFCKLVALKLYACNFTTTNFMTTWTGDVAGGARSWVEAQVGAAYKGCWKLSAQEAKVRVAADKAAALLKCSGNDGVIVTPMERDSGRSVVWLPAPTSGSASAGYLKQAREDAQKHGGLVVVNSRGLGLSLPKDRAATVCLAVKGVLADDEHPLFAVDVDANVDADHLVAQIGGRFVTARNLGHGQRRVWFRVARDHRKFVLCDGANSLEAWPTRYVPSWREWMAWESKPASTTKTPATPSAPAKGVPGSRLEEESKSKSKRERERKKRKKEEGAKRTAPAPTPQAKQAAPKVPYGPVHQPHLAGGPQQPQPETKLQKKLQQQLQAQLILLEKQQQEQLREQRKADARLQQQYQKQVEETKRVRKLLQDQKEEAAEFRRLLKKLAAATEPAPVQEEAAALAEVARLKAQIAAEAGARAQERTAADTEVARLQQEKDASDAEVSRLTVEAATASKAREQERITVDAVRSQLEFEVASARRAKDAAAVDATAGETAELAFLRAKTATLETELARCRGKANDDSDALDLATASLEHLQDKCVQEVEATKAATALTAQAVAELAQVQEQVAAAEKAKVASDCELASLRAQAASGDAARTHSETSRAEYVKEKEAELARVQEQVAAAEKAKVASDCELASLRAQVASGDAARAQSETSRAEKEAELARVREEAAVAEKEKAAMAASEGATFERVTRLQDMLSERQAAVDAALESAVQSRAEKSLLMSAFILVARDETSGSEAAEWRAFLEEEKVVREIEQVRAALRRAPEASVASSPKAKGVDLAGEKKARAKENKKARDEKLKGAVEEKRKAAEAPAKACAQPATVAPKNE